MPTARTLAEAFRVALQGQTTATWGSVAVKRVLLQAQRDDWPRPDDGTEVGWFRISMDFDVVYAESIPAL